MKKPSIVSPLSSTPRRKALVRPLPRVEASAVRSVTRLEERGAIRYPSLTSVSMETLSALLDEALRAVSRPAMAGAVGLMIMASGCVDGQDAPPAATLAPLGEVHDMSEHDAPPKLTLPGAGGWGSLAAGAGGSDTPTTGTDTGTPVKPCDTGGSATPCDGDGHATPCDGDGLAADVDGGVDAGRHVAPHHNTPNVLGRMPLIRSIRTAGAPMRVAPLNPGDDL